MSTHVSDELPRLLTGEASRDVVLDAAAHLRTCVDCQQELVLAVVAHASLTSAQRFAPEIVSGPTGPEPTSEEEHVATPALPDLSGMFARVRNEAAAPARRPGSRRLQFGLAAAAAVVVVGAGTYAIVANTGGGSQKSGAQTVALHAFDRGRTPATAKVTASGQMDIDAASLPSLDTSHYEVWLTNPQRTHLQPVGWIGADGKATLTVPASLMNRYSDIEVSVQDIGSPTYNYSGTSVLRGTYA
jgi:hypothetical protein